MFILLWNALFSSVQETRGVLKNTYYFEKQISPLVSLTATSFLTVTPNKDISRPPNLNKLYQLERNKNLLSLYVRENPF